MSNKITFDLQLLELALSKAIEVMNAESTLLSSRINIKPEELERLSNEKEDIMQFIDWHIPIIVRYIKMHKDDLDDIQDLSNLAIKARAINSTVQSDIQKKVNLSEKKVISGQKISTITVIGTKLEQKPILEALFINDSDEMPKTITRLLKEMFTALENNFNKLYARMNLNSQIFEVVSQTMKEKQKVSYNPKSRKENIHGNLIYNEDC